MDPLADPIRTSALRPFSLAVILGDDFQGICTGDDKTTISVKVPLASGPAQLLFPWDNSSPSSPSPVMASFNADRTELSIAVTDPRLRGLNLICASFNVSKEHDERSQYGSSSFDFLLDGFSA